MSIKCNGLISQLEKLDVNLSPKTVTESLMNIIYSKLAAHPEELVTMVVLCQLGDGTYISLAYLVSYTGLDENNVLFALAALHKMGWIQIGPGDEITVRYDNIYKEGPLCQ